MGLVVAERIVRWAVVGAFNHDGLASVVAANVGVRCELPALATARGEPVASAEGLRNCGTSVEEGSVWVAGWRLEQSVGVAVNLLAGAAKTASTSSTTAVPVASGRGPASVGLGCDKGD
jgi:hypothetical protein